MYMKMFYRFFGFALMAALLLPSCNVNELRGGADEGDLVVVLSGVDVMVKADTGASTGETALSDTQVFLFNTNDGTLYRKETLRENGSTFTIKKIKEGIYDVVAVSNLIELMGEEGDITPATKAELDAFPMKLSLCDPEKGFVMYGIEKAVKVYKNSGGGADQSGSAARATITLSRFASRVRLVSVKNNLADVFGDLHLDYVFLENGYGTWSLGGDVNGQGLYAVSEPVNWAGRLEGKSGLGINTVPSPLIVSEEDAMYPKQTFRNIDMTIQKGLTETLGYCLYTLPNPYENIEDQADGPASATQPAYLRIVVHATFTGMPNKSFYYPITIRGGRDYDKAVARNTTYDVSMTILGDGVLDPNQEIRHGNLEFSFTVAPWDEGSDIHKTY